MGTKLAANAALRRTLDEEKLRQLLDWVESVVGELEAQNQGEDDGGTARLSEKLANQQALRHRVGQALEELPDRERPNRYKRTNRINLTDKDASITTTVRKKGTWRPLHRDLPVRLAALWPCLPRSDFRPITDQIEQASL